MGFLYTLRNRIVYSVEMSMSKDRGSGKDGMSKLRQPIRQGTILTYGPFKEVVCTFKKPYYLQLCTNNTGAIYRTGSFKISFLVQRLMLEYPIITAIIYS